MFKIKKWKSEAFKLVSDVIYKIGNIWLDKNEPIKLNKINLEIEGDLNLIRKGGVYKNIC